MFKEPLSVYLADFGEDVMVDSVVIRAIFDREYLPATGFGLSAANADPLLVAVEAELPENIRGAEIVVRGKVYRAAEIDYDGTGMAVIQLRSADGQTSVY